MDMECDAGVDWVQARLGLRGMGGWKVIYEDRGGYLPRTRGVSGSWTGKSPPSSPALLAAGPQCLSCPPGGRGKVGRMFGYRDGSLVGEALV